MDDPAKMHDNDYVFPSHIMKFLHVPKSGGTTFRETSKRFNLPIQCEKLHQPISKHCPTSDFKYIIILRNPINRVTSYYNMVLQAPHPKYCYKRYIGSLDIFMNNCWEVNNQVTVYLAGIYKGYTKEIVEITDEIFQIAKKNLESMYKIIIFENLENEIMDFFNNEFNVNCKNNHIRNFRASKYEQLSSEEIELVKKHNKYDIMLYEYAISLCK